jgi:hypothetical protein
MTNTATTVFDQTFSRIWADFMYSFVLFVPRFLFALAILSVGIYLAHLAHAFVLKLFKTALVKQMLTTPAVSLVLKSTQLTSQIDNIVASAVSFITISFFVIFSINLLGLTTVSQFIFSLLSFVPVLLTALVTLILGLLLSGFVEKSIKNLLTSLDIHLSRIIAKIASYVVLVITIMATLRQLGIAQSFIDILFTGFIMTITLALGLGIGLGSKDVFSRILNGWYDQYSKPKKKAPTRG